ncbi:MAG: hypothetical protein HYZ73_05575 [Elusimicrobia bacterium]|nr:hypothetical protein [Elusimicrobiota bacterium]
MPKKQVQRAEAGTSTSSLLSLGLLVGLLIGVGGCRKGSALKASPFKVTYLKGELTTKLARVAKADYGLDIQAQVVGRTLGVSVPLDGLVERALERNSKTFNKLGDLLFLLTRATLSTDAPLEFFVLTAKDPKYPDLELIFTRYIPDVKLLYFEDISRGEFFHRMLVEVKVNGERSPIDLSEAGLLKLYALVSSVMTRTDMESPSVVSDSLTGNKAERQLRPPWRTEEVRLPQFIAQLATGHIKRALEEHRHIRKTFTVEHVEGTFREGIFQLTLKVQPKLVITPQWDRAPSLGPQDGLLPWLVQVAARAIRRLLPPPPPPAPQTIEQDVLPPTAEEMTRLIRRYRFRDFQAIHIHEQNSGRSLIIPFHDVLKPKRLLGIIGRW